MHDNRGSSDVIIVDSMYPKTDQNANTTSSFHKSMNKNIPSRDGGDREKRNVSFDQIIIREYFIEIGDNPSCSGGPPVTIGWEYDEVGCMDLEEYEECRPTRRFGRQMLLPLETRTQMIEESGISPSEVKSIIKDVDNDREQRMRTARSKVDKKNIGEGTNNKSKLKKFLKSPRKSR